MTHDMYHHNKRTKSHSQKLPLSLHTLPSLPLWHQGSKPKAAKKKKQMSRSHEGDVLTQTDWCRLDWSLE
jgi:hypothetical protein